MRRPRSRPAKFAVSFGLFLVAAVVAAVAPILRWPSNVPDVACFTAIALCAWTVRLRFWYAVLGVLTGALMVFVAADAGTETALASHGRETTAVVSAITEDGRRYEFVEVGSLDELGRWDGAEGEFGPGERLQVVVDPAGRLGPAPFDDVDDSVVEWGVSVALLALTALFCWPASGRLRRIKASELPGAAIQSRRAAGCGESKPPNCRVRRFKAGERPDAAIQSLRTAGCGESRPVSGRMPSIKAGEHIRSAGYHS
ncbi:hypothetical protein Ait01nite_047990 [Actinoplanes italicus]|nr:hypothetical protein [Actinoplanes italicus]GIE31754.1 hypothetical protein Ait01nite_047990 [Actinoplanes italicus]